MSDWIKANMAKIGEMNRVLVVEGKAEVTPDGEVVVDCGSQALCIMADPKDPRGLCGGNMSNDGYISEKPYAYLKPVDAQTFASSFTRKVDGVAAPAQDVYILVMDSAKDATTGTWYHYGIKSECLPTLRPYQGGIAGESSVAIANG